MALPQAKVPTAVPADPVLHPFPPPRASTGAVTGVMLRFQLSGGGVGGDS